MFWTQSSLDNLKRVWITDWQALHAVRTAVLLDICGKIAYAKCEEGFFLKCLIDLQEQQQP